MGSKHFLYTHFYIFFLIASLHADVEYKLLRVLARELTNLRCLTHRADVLPPHENTVHANDNNGGKKLDN